MKRISIDEADGGYVVNTPESDNKIFIKVSDVMYYVKNFLDDDSDNETMGKEEAEMQL